MKRLYCSSCHRPEVTCICHLAVNIANQVHVVILQHPTEVKQSKGTVTLLDQSLSSSQVIVGETFTDNVELQNTLAKFSHVALLYPSEHAVEASADFYKIAKQGVDARQSLEHKLLEHEQVVGDKCSSDLDNIDLKNCCLIILDGTWKKAYRMFMLNSFLHGLPHMTLPEGLVGQYHVRKTQKAGALSSLEACCYALAIIEGHKKEQHLGIYQPIFSAFAQFNNSQLAFRTSQ